MKQTQDKMKSKTTPIQVLGLSTKAETCLLAEDIFTVEELIYQCSFQGERRRLLKIPGCGRVMYEEIKHKLDAYKNDNKKIDLVQEYINELEKIQKPAIKAADMDLRDYFAAKAMQSLASQSHDELCEWLDEVPEGHMGYTVNLLATVSYEIADAMLRARMEK
jgi:hypothetical protein